LGPVMEASGPISGEKKDKKTKPAHQHLNIWTESELEVGKGGTHRRESGASMTKERA